LRLHICIKECPS